MDRKINIERAFTSIFKNPKWKKYCLIGGIVQTMSLLSYFSNAVQNNILTTTLCLLSFVSSLYLFGFWIDTIQRNTTDNDTENLKFAEFSLFNTLISGITFNILYLLLFVLLTIIILCITAPIIIALLLCMNSFSEYMQYMAIIIMCLIIFIAIIVEFMAMILFYPQTCSNYVQNGSISICNIPLMLKKTKNNLANSFTASIMTIVLIILSLIPFVGFYFEMVWASLYAQYNNCVENK